jgi:uncharacterized protein YlbG (UPF0298 family)
MQPDTRGIEQPLEYIEKRRFNAIDYRNAMKEITNMTITREKIEARLQKLVELGYIRQVKPGTFEECRTVRHD